LPKFSEAGSKAAADETPVPLNCVVCGEPEPLSLTVKVPLRVPSTEGVKVSEILQLAPAARVLGASGQVVEDSAKSPDGEMLLMVSGELRVLVSVAFWAVLVVCTTQFPKERVVGLTV
jgi:hypothetical protein